LRAAGSPAEHTGAYDRDDVRQAAAFISGLAIALVAAGSAFAAHVVTLAPGGYVYLAGTSIRCGSEASKGVTFVSCGVVLASGDSKRGSYVAGMESNGRTVVIHAIKPGDTPTVFDRTPAAAVVKVVVKPGDVISLPGTPIACSADSVNGKPTIFCDLLDAKGRVRANSYAFGIGDTVVTSLAWDAKGHVHLLKSWPENG